MLANENWGLCAIPTVTPLVIPPNSPEQPINVTSDFLNLTKGEVLTFTGNVLLKQKPDLTIVSESLTFHKNSSLMEVSTPSLFSTHTSTLKSDSFSFNSKEKAGQYNEVDVAFLENHRFVTAKTLLQLNADLQQFDDLSYTSCEPGDESWSLQSASLTMDKTTGMGVAKHVTIRLLELPIFYFPYFQFPIDSNRHSGLLMPGFEISNSNGNLISLPWYLNIHPQLDTTLTFDAYSKRGLLLKSTTRYLTESSSGTLFTSAINDEETNQSRYFHRFDHRASLAENLNLTIVAQTASEQDYLNDFSGQGITSAPDYLDSTLILTHNKGRWTNTLLAQQHQIINEDKTIAEQPYARLPSLTTRGQYKLFDQQATLDINGSYVRFYKKESIIGDRFILNPILSTEWLTSYSFIKPKLNLFYKQYDIDQLDDTSELINLSASIFSIDSGLFFERIASEEKAWLQTLEPRLFYLNAPYHDQSNIPDFDTAFLSPNYANLFIDNRFNGGDRVGDAQQLTLGLSSKILNINSGLELFRVSLGQTHFAADRRVQLTGTAVTEDKKSNLFLELASQPATGWRITANATRDANSQFLTQKTLSVTQRNKQQLINLNYRFKGTENTTELEQTDVSAVYSVSNQWKLFAKRQFSLVQNQFVEQLIGISYDNCCWNFSFIALDSSNDDFTETDRTLFFQLNLKGLTNIGRKNHLFLQKRIPGYQPTL